VEVSETSKERGAVGFIDLGGLLLNQLLTGGRQSAHDQRGRLRPIGGRGVDPRWCLQMSRIGEDPVVALGK
jgi:hypothetical protein